MIIGITGTHGSGKDTLAEHLEKAYGFGNYSTAGELRTILRQFGLPLDRRTMQIMGNALRELWGHEELARRAYERAVSSGNGRVLISSLRSSQEVAHLRTQTEVYMIGVDAPRKLRWERVHTHRGRESDDLPYEAFCENEDKELNDRRAYGMNINQCLAVCDSVLENDETLEAFIRKIDELMQLKLKLTKL